ncbi:thiamine diphosphokinase [Niallia sp. 03133]|uniref:thiamine diphosphokinase n=1 Tax=Niallia sp. 03133 TaxID=3458060 RepID=UPI004043D152
MNIHIMAGGPENYIPDLARYSNDESVWIGVDRGVLYLLKRDIPVKTVFGDFDSVNEQEWQEIMEHSSTINKFNPEKDETDMELALNWAVKRRPDTIRLFGATGGRLDHTVANIQLLLKEIMGDSHIHIEIIDKQNIVSIVTEGTHTLKRQADYPYVSFFPYSTNIVGLTLKGFKYPLNDRHIPVSSTLCISNELISDYGTFSFTKGILMVIRSHD